MHSIFLTTRHQIRGVLLLATVLVLLALGVPAAQAGSLYSMVPLDSPVAGSVDVPWVWKATAKYRENEMINSVLQGAQQSLGLSFENDLLSWVGQAGFTITEIRNDDPAMALFFQIRDPEHMVAPAKVATVVQTLLGDAKKTINWVPMDYKGIAIRRAEIAQGKSVLKLATATVDGWLVITIGDGAIRKVIDAHNGDIASLEKHPLFARATGGLPADAVGQVCVNGQGIVAQIGKTDAEVAKELQNSELSKFFIAGALSYPDENLVIDANYCTASPTTQATLKELRADAGTVSGASLAQLPAGAFAAVLITNPDRWINAVEQFFLDATRDKNEKQWVREGFAQIDDLRNILKRCGGEVGVGISYREDKGFGITLAGETYSGKEATGGATAIESFMKKMAMTVEKKDDLYTLPSTKGDMTSFATLLCWTTREQWMVGASHPEWMKPAARPMMTLPASAKGASLAAFGDLSFLPSLMKSMGMGGDSMGGDMMTTWFHLLNPSIGKWELALKIDDDGGAAHCHIAGIVPVAAIGASVMFPVFAKARQKARQTTSISQLRQVACAMQMYAQDNNDHLPTLKTAADTKKITAYLGDSKQMLISPLTNEPYTFNPLINGRTMSSFPDLSIIIVAYEKTPGPDGIHCAAFLDGHVAVFEGPTWEAAKKRSKIP